jgi:hypothetical protein
VDSNASQVAPDGPRRPIARDAERAGEAPVARMTAPGKLAAGQILKDRERAARN